MDTLIEYYLAPQVRAFSTTRISPFPFTNEEIAEMGNYGAFNVTHYCGDDETRVLRNREWLCDELAVSSNHLILPRQTHTANVLDVSTEILEMSKEEQQLALENVDAVITSVKNVCIGVSTADCVPILLYDEVLQVVAAVHAGWRGTINKIICNTISQMRTLYGTKPCNLKAAIGPCISAEAFEVGNEVAVAFDKADFPASVILPAGKFSSKPHIDLCAANCWLMEEAGVLLQNMQICNVCTYRKFDTFFSARRLGIESGRIFTGICLK